MATDPETFAVAVEPLEAVESSLRSAIAGVSEDLLRPLTTSDSPSLELLSGHEEKLLGEEDLSTDGAPCANDASETASVEQVSSLSLAPPLFRVGPVGRVLLLDLYFLLIAALITVGCWYLPLIPVSWFWRGHVDLGALAVWMLALLLGFCYVAAGTEHRPSPFLSRRGEYWELLKLLLSGPVLFMTAPSVALSPETPAIPYACFVVASFFLPFLIGLHYTYLDRFKFLQLAGDKCTTPSEWKTCLLAEICFCLAMTFVGGLYVSWGAYQMLLLGYAVVYLACYAAAGLLVLLVTCLLRDSHYLHFHHYMLFGSFIPLFVFPNAYGAVGLGLATGPYVEGIARWSMAAWWYRGTREGHNPIRPR